MSDRAALDRTHELLCDRALEGLDDAEGAELEELLAAAADVDPDALDRAAASLALLISSPADEPLPASLQARIESQAHSFFSPPAPAARRAPPPAPSAPARASIDWIRWSGWIAAAACLLLAAAAWLRAPAPPLAGGSAPGPAGASATAPVASIPAPPVPPARPSPEQDRQRLLDAARDVVRVAWQPTKDAAAQGVSGDVVWSDAEQRGYLRFRGLPVNPGAQFQYQLWIFDRTQDPKTPIDGGVFDVVAAEGELIVPISAKLRVDAPTLFAVTIEKPGGVVVSSRKRLVLAAPVRS